jgi:hypothetical protein
MKQIRQKLRGKLELKIITFWGICFPGFYYFKNYPPPWIQSFIFPIIICLSGLCFFFIYWTYKKQNLEKIKKIGRSAIIIFLICFPLYLPLFNQTTIKWPKTQQFEQVGFDLWEKGLTQDALGVLSSDCNGVRIIRTKDDLLQCSGYIEPRNKAIERNWKRWTIYSSGGLLVLCFFSTFISWSLGIGVLSIWLKK